MKQSALLILTAAICGFAADTGSTGAVDVKAAFSRLKSLVGEWEAKTSNGTERLSYELIAGGTALVERETADGRAAMLTVYYIDGNRLMLTHYCMAGNQPRMQARRFDPNTGMLRFEFVDAGNLAGKDAGHMHNASLRLVDQGHLTADWEFYEGGKSKFTESAQYSRVR